MGRSAAVSARFLVAVLLAPEVILAPLFSPLVLLDAAEIIIAAAAIIFLTAPAIVLLMTKILVAVHFLWPFAVIAEGGTWGLWSANGSVSFCTSGTLCGQMSWHGPSSRRSRMTKSSCRMPGAWKRDCRPSRSKAAIEGLR